LPFRKICYTSYMVRVAINGYGRIGRVAHRVILERYAQDIEIVAINAGHSTDIKGWMYLTQIRYFLRPDLLNGCFLSGKRGKSRA
jgi:hypothetical protein